MSGQRSWVRLKFTRFGAKVEATIETKIKRGRVLREILKQDRLSPMPIEFQLAWLTAFNRGLFDDVPPEQIGPMLKHMASRLSTSRLSLDQQDEQWGEAVTGWLKEGSVT